MNKDLTVGSPGRSLIMFTIPLFISVMFQQMYNIADSVIAGKFAGEDALAAIGASYPITMIFMAVAVGCQIGCSVVISKHFGAGNMPMTKTCISTALISGTVLSAVLTVVGVLFSGVFMQWVQTPDNIFDDGCLYLMIYTGGFVFLFIYNVVTGIFNSLGDSKTPLYLLIGSSIGNVILDCIFIIPFQMGVAGAAWATFIAQGAACLLALFLLLRRVKSMNISGGRLFSGAALADICKVAVPSVLQQSFISVGNLFIQYMVNGFGSSAIVAGYSAAIKLNTFAITCFTTIGNGMSSFTAQNIGANKPERIKQGFRSVLIFSLATALVFFLLFFLLNHERGWLAARHGYRRQLPADSRSVLLHRVPETPLRRSPPRQREHGLLHGGDLHRPDTPRCPRRDTLQCNERRYRHLVLLAGSLGCRYGDVRYILQIRDMD